MYRHKNTGDILTDVIVSHNFVDGSGDLYSFRYDEETTYRTYTKKLFDECFEKVAKSEDGEYVALPGQGYLVFLHIVPSLKRMDLHITKASLTERDHDKIFFTRKENALTFFDKVIALYPDYQVNIKDTGY